MDIGKKTKEGIIWIFFLNGFQFLFRFVGSVILARILFPEDFGLMAIIMIAIQLARRLTNFGFTMVLVQRKSAQPEHFQTVFVCNLLLMWLLTCIVFFGAKSISIFFESPKIEPMLKIISFIFIIQSFASVPSAILRRTLRFKELGFSNTVGSFVETISAICFAWFGFGAYSLVYGIVIRNVSQVIMVYCYTKWKPNFKFHLWALKDIFGFGLWVYIASYVNYGINQIDFFLIGKLLGPAQLGFYERAFNLMRLPVNQIGMKIEGILLSSFSRVQDEKERIVKAMLRLINYFSFLSYFLMTWMYFAAPSLIEFLYGSKWSSSSQPLQIMCIAGAVQTITLVLSPVIISQGLIGERTRRNIVYLLVLAVTVYIGLKWGIVGVSIGVTLASMFHLILMLSLAGRRLKFSVWDFFKAQRSAAIYSLLLIIALTISTKMLTSYFPVESWKMLISTIFLTVISLFAIHMTLRFDDVETIFSSIRGEISKRLHSK